MMDSERHEMELERTHPSGAEEWYCPTCGRRFLMQWPPNYKKIVLEQGDMYASHSAGRVSVGTDLAQMMPPDSSPEPTRSAEDLAESSETRAQEAPPPWLKWLEDYDPAAE